jgi:hypothetical protein
VIVGGKKLRAYTDRHGNELQNGDRVRVLFEEDLPEEGVVDITEWNDHDPQYQIHCLEAGVVLVVTDDGVAEERYVDRIEKVQ